MRGPVRLGQWTAGVVALAVLAACGEEPTPPRLTGFVPASPSVTANETIDIQVTYEAHDFKLDAFEWTAEAGEIEGNGKPEITYRAPDTAGDYKLTVTTTAVQDGLPDLSLDTVVKVLPAPTPAVSDTATGEAGASSTAPTASTGQATASAAASAEQPSADTAVDPNAGQKAASAARAALQSTASAAAGAGEEVVEAAETGVEGAGQQVAEVGQQAAEPAQVEDATASESSEAGPIGTTSSDAGSGAVTPPATGEPASGEATVAALTESSATTGDEAPDGVGAIVDRGRLTVVVEDDFAPFSSADDAGRRVGFDVDMSHEFARRWLRDPEAVTFVPVNPEQRIAALEEGRADLVAAALTRTASREQTIDFSQTYFKDGQRLLVAEDAEIAGPCDLAGKKVAAVAGTTSFDNIKTEGAACGFAIEDDLVVFERQDQALAALLAGEVAAFTSDGVALEQLAKDQPLKVVGNHFSEEPYGVGVPKGDERLRRLVDLTLQQMEEDGTYAAIYQKWFGDALSPYPLEAVPDLAGDSELMALATTDLPALFEPVPEQAPAGGDYVVQPGDTLSTIAGKHYGDVAPGAWRALYQANKAAIGDDPNRIEVGMRLTLPSSL